MLSEHKCTFANTFKVNVDYLVNTKQIQVHCKPKKKSVFFHKNTGQ